MIGEPGLIRAPSATDGLSARMIAAAGFEAIHLTGSGVARSMGYPDIGLVTMTEVIDRARAMARSVAIPVIADADTGYGNALNVIRTIQEFEAAGVAGLHLEDQVTPKRCGHYEGKQLIPAEEMALKIEAACAARRDPDFVIVARTDARAVEGFDAAIKRAELYAEAGADVLFVEAPESRAEVERIAAGFKVPLLINMYSGGRTPLVSTADLRSLGYRIVIWPSHLQRATIAAIRRALDLLQREDLGAADDPALMVSFAEREAIVGLAEASALEQRFLQGRLK
ncbi:MAG: isocitrate lyase/PEP mutase family protein [Betaproteobacteria bacterium]|nr:isocitrate lyase/PEP mutase family protein [Betaproteobacteria bacterium]